MSKSLDIGCGDVPRNPFLADEIFGVDVRDNLEGTIRCADLAVEPIPFPDDHFDYVTAHDFLEHIPRIIYYASSDSSSKPVRRNAFVELMNEIHRVLKPGGLFLSITPAYPHGVAFRDPTHVNFITDETFPLYFDNECRWASVYGFKGAFRVCDQKHEGMQIRAILQKVEIPKDGQSITHINKKISIIIPIYNGEKHLSATLQSILAQTFNNYEVLCIDDCSTDSSEGIVQEFCRLDARVRAIKTPSNLGSAPKVVNFALQHASGELFVYSSQDDLFSEDWLEQMHSRICETGADAVIPKVVMYYEKEPSRNRMMEGLDGNHEVLLTGREAMEHTLDWRIPGNALWNIDIIRNLGFEEFAVNSDEYSVRRFFLQCKKIAFSQGTFYYRQDNDQAITKSISAHTFDWPYTQLRIAQLMQEHSFPATMVQRETEKAVASMKQLKKWIASNKHQLTPDALLRIDSKIARYEDRLTFQYPFSKLPKKKKWPGELLAKGQRSIKKISPRISKWIGLS